MKNHLSKLSQNFWHKVLVKALAEKLALIGIRSETLTDDNLSRSLVLNSPITGFVAKVNANIGKYLSPGEIFV